MAQLKVIGIVAGLAIAAPLHAQLPFRLAGEWSGAFSRLGSIQQVDVELRESGDGLAGSYDIPELGLFGEPLTEVSRTDTTLAFHLIYGRFDMRITAAEAQLTGVNTRWNPPVGLHLKKARRAPAYDTVPFRVRNGSATIAGTLYRPRGSLKPRLVVLAGGSTQSTRSVWEYRGWGPSLASRGIAAAVYDRRGFGASTGDSVEVDLATEADDVVAIIRHLTRRPDLDERHAGILGGSRGGWVAALAALRSRDIGFVVLECAPAVDVLEQELQRVRHTEATDSLSAADIAAAEAYTRLVVSAARNPSAWPMVVAASQNARKAKWVSIVQIPERQDELVWWQRNVFDQAATLRNIRRPVLAFFGAEDRTVPPSENAEAMRAAVTAGGSPFQLYIVPRAGHGLFSFGTLRGGWKWPEGYWIWSSKAAGVFDTVANWVLAL